MLPHKVRPRLPILVELHAERNEYGSPIATIIPRLNACARPEQVQFVVEDEMHKHDPQADLTGTDWNALAAEWGTSGGLSDKSDHSAPPQ